MPVFDYSHFSLALHVRPPGRDHQGNFLPGPSIGVRNRIPGSQPGFQQGG